MILFLIILSAAAFTDLKYRYIPGAFLVFAAVFGAALAISEGRSQADILMSSAAGLFLLLLGRITGGAIGEGDGWFFIVSGFFLSPGENILLLISGIFLCGIASLVIVIFTFVRGKSASKIRIPFLPFLIPGGIWLTFFSG